MKSFEAEAVVLAGSDTVWDIITDGGNYPVWDSGVTELRGEVRHGASLRIRTQDSGKRTLRVRVRQAPRHLMTWSRGLPLGLLTVTHTFTLNKHADGTVLSVRRTGRGPLRILARKAQNRSDASLASYVDAVKFRAELLSVHLDRAGVPAQRSAGHNDADTRTLQLSGPSH